MDAMTDVNSHPLKPGFGAKILDVDVKRADDATLGGVEEPSEALIATQDRFVFRHKWGARTLHTGALYDDARYCRVMHRLWVEGDSPCGTAR